MKWWHELDPYLSPLRGASEIHPGHSGLGVPPHMSQAAQTLVQYHHYHSSEATALSLAMATKYLDELTFPPEARQQKWQFLPKNGCCYVPEVCCHLCMIWSTFTNTGPGRGTLHE